MTESDSRNIQLVSKLRKIKENLEFNNYLTSELRVRHGENNVLIDDKHLKCLKNLNGGKEIQNGSGSPCKESSMSMVNSIFKYSLINRHNFEFDVNTNSSVFENLLNDLTSNSSSLPIKFQENRNFPHEKRVNSKLTSRKRFYGSAEIPIINLNQPENATNFVNINKTMYNDNVSRQSSIRSLINMSSTTENDKEKETKSINPRLDVNKNVLVNLDSFKLKTHSRHMASPNLCQHNESRTKANTNYDHLNQNLPYGHSETNYPISLSSSLNSSILSHNNNQKTRNDSALRNSNEFDFQFTNGKVQINELQNTFNPVQNDVLNDFESSVKFDDQQFNEDNSIKCFSDEGFDFDVQTHSDVLSDDLNSVDFYNKTNLTPMVRRNRMNEFSVNSNYTQERLVSYEKLSHSINDLFSNLLAHLETQKKKDYLNDTLTGDEDSYPSAKLSLNNSTNVSGIETINKRANSIRTLADFIEKCHDLNHVSEWIRSIGKVSKSSFKTLFKRQYSHMNCTDQVLNNLYSFYFEAECAVDGENNLNEVSYELEDPNNTTLNSRNGKSYDLNESSTSAFGFPVQNPLNQNKIRKLKNIKNMSKRESYPYNSLKNNRQGSMPEIRNLDMFDQTGQNSQSYNGFTRRHKDNDILKCDLTKSNLNLGKNSVVLEILRAGKFKSKSMTDMNNAVINSEMKNQTDSLNNFRSCSNQISNISDLENLNTESYTGLIWQCADMSYDNYTNKYKELKWLMNGDIETASQKLKEVEQRLKIELKMINTPHKSFQNKKNSTIQAKSSLKEENQSEISLSKETSNNINQKIKEMHRIRLFLKICEINNKGLNENELNVFFGFNEDTTSGISSNKLKGMPKEKLLSSLYLKESICNGFVYQFFVVYRYIISSLELFNFFKENFYKAYKNSFFSVDKSFVVIDRTIDLLGMWIDGFYVVDFQQNGQLREQFIQFVINHIALYDELKSKLLLNSLYNPNLQFSFFADHKLNLKSKGKSLIQRFKKNNKILNSSLLDLRKRVRANEGSVDLLNSTISSMSKLSSFSICDFSIELVANQLTLIEWDNFLDIHVCHCLNSKAQGIKCNSKTPIDSTIYIENSLFVENYVSKSIYRIIQFSHQVSHWVAAEILLVENEKSQIELITRFLKIAKKCLEHFNFSSAFCIYDGLHNVMVRYLPAWHHVPQKSMNVLDEIASFKVLFQNEPFFLNKISNDKCLPVIPSIHTFLLTVQQNEHGNFKLTNGLWKWTKLQNLAFLVDQIRNVQQHFDFGIEPNYEFVNDLLQRVSYINDFNLNDLAEKISVDHQSKKLSKKIIQFK